MPVEKPGPFRGGLRAEFRFYGGPAYRQKCACGSGLLLECFFEFSGLRFVLFWSWVDAEFLTDMCELHRIGRASVGHHDS